MRCYSTKNSETTFVGFLETNSSLLSYVFYILKTKLVYLVSDISISKTIVVYA